MKIGVVTTQYASNYGALLQTYALQQYLNHDCGSEAEVLNYFPKHYMNYWKLIPTARNIKGMVANGIYCLQPWRIYKKSKRFKAYKEFLSNRVKCSKAYFSKEDIEKDECPYDMLFCGSDQIWNVSRHDLIDPVWFLAFDGNWGKIKKVAYAPSVADFIPQKHKNTLRKYLNKFSAVSVRENDDVVQLEELFDGKIYHVCDPVFLLSPEAWRSIIVKPKLNQPYILCYFLNPSREAAEIVSHIKSVTGRRIVQIDINNLNKIKCDKDIIDATPEEFLGLIDNAEYVITNSFHCTAFSVLFEKNILVVRKKTANARMESLLEKIGLEDRVVSLKEVKKMDEIDLEVDYSLCRPKLYEFIEYSKNYLAKVIEENG